MDRNQVSIVARGLFQSLSARRAWIEIFGFGAKLVHSFLVALRKESVDRNSESTLKRGGYAVALRKESVDRNRNTPNKLTNAHSRSPQGERG